MPRRWDAGNRAQVILVVLVLLVTGGCKPSLCVRAGLAGRIGLPVGAEQRFGAGLLDILEECDRPPPPSVQWRSSDPGVATVDTSGIVRGVAVGRVEIVVGTGLRAVRVPIDVVPEVGTVRLSPRDARLTVGDTASFEASALDRAGRPLPGVQVLLYLTSAWSGPKREEAILIPRNLSGESRANRLAVMARREGTTWIKGEVVGTADSVMVTVVKQ